MKLVRGCIPASLFLLCTLGCQHVAPAPAPSSIAPSVGALHSPWDLTPVAPSPAPYACPTGIVVSTEVTVTGPSDSKQHVSEDVKAVVYLQSTTAIDDMASTVVAAADAYQHTGSLQAAGCALHIIAANAAAHAMTGYMASDDAGAHRSYAVRGIVLAYLKVRSANIASPADTDVILNWFEDFVHIERAHYDHSPCDKEHCYIHNHKGNSVAMLAAAVAVAANDPGLFHWAIGEYHSAVGDINARGMLYYDTKNQGKYAFKDNLRSAACLVQIAELAEINGVPLYGYDDGRIHLLIHTVALGLVSTEPYHSVTKSKQWSPSTVEPWMILWASVYNRRFPDPVVNSLLQQVGPASADMWGGEPWSPDAS